jgi:hypothetical protein
MMRAAQAQRALTSKEMTLLTWLLEHSSPEAKSFIPQLEKIKVSRGCDCGCPSIKLYVDESVSLGLSSSNIISDVVGMTTEDKSVGLLLFQNDGKLTELEVYSIDDIEGDWGFPVLDSLHKIEWVDQPIQKGSKG